MENTLNQPQATYTKNSNTGSYMPNMQDNNYQSNNNNNQKGLRNIFAVAGVVTFLIVAVMGVFIAQRQRSQDGQVEPVAPTGPASRPSADLGGNGCYLTFVVPGVPNVPSITCLEKQLWDINQKTQYSKGSTITRDTQYVYRIKVSSENITGMNIVIEDALPPELTYVGPTKDSENYEIKYDKATNMLTANLGSYETFVPGPVISSLGLIVEVPENAQAGNVVNSAKSHLIDAQGKIVNEISKDLACTINNTILPNGIADCLHKKAYTNFRGNEITSGSKVKRGDEFVYKITVKAVGDNTSGAVTVVDELDANLKFIDDTDNTDGLSYDANTRKVSLSLGSMTKDQEVVVQFKVQVVTNPTDTSIDNKAIIATAGQTTQDVCEMPLIIESPVISCNSTCDENADCSGISGGNHICYDAGGSTGKVCRLAENPTNNSCEPEEDEPVCNDRCTANSDCSENHICYDAGGSTGKVCRLGTYPTQTSCQPPQDDEPVCNDRCEQNSDCDENHICYNAGGSTGKVCRLPSNPSNTSCRPSGSPTPTPSPTPSPTPAIGCNDKCATNADCEGINHICVSTADGNKCRLESYPNSTTCTAPMASTQPELPTELPQTGPADWVNWLKAGLVTLGVGAALFLLL